MEAISQTIGRAVKFRGRTDECDLFGERGGYERILSSAVKGELCPRCGDEAIIKENFLGGSVYYCPKCQVPPPRAPRRSASRKKKR